MLPPQRTRRHAPLAAAWQTRSHRTSVLGLVPGFGQGLLQLQTHLECHITPSTPQLRMELGQRQTQRREASVLGRESPAITFLRAVPNTAGHFRTKTRQKASRHMERGQDTSTAAPRGAGRVRRRGRRRLFLIHLLHHWFFTWQLLTPPPRGDRVLGVMPFHRARGIPGQRDCVIQRARQIPPIQKWLFSLCEGNGTQSQGNVPGGTSWPSWPGLVRTHHQARYPPWPAALPPLQEGSARACSLA